MQILLKPWSRSPLSASPLLHEYAADPSPLVVAVAADNTVWVSSDSGDINHYAADGTLLRSVGDHPVTPHLICKRIR